jgi:prephenate dehydrogenase
VGELKLAVIGFGLIGGSIGLAARQRWPAVHVTAIDRQPVVDAALRQRIADAGGISVALAADADIVVLSAPVRQNVAILADLARDLAGEALITDVGGTKQATLDAGRQLPARLRFIGGHPLAGAASGGLNEARADLFRGRPWILTPPDTSLPQDVERLRTFVTGLGARPKIMEAAAHDHLMAYLSHLPQIAVSALMQVVGEHAGADGLHLAGSGLRDTTRLAASPPGTWRDVAATNVEAVSVAIDELTASLQRLKADLTTGDELQKVFDSARRWKAALEESETVDRTP